MRRMPLVAAVSVVSGLLFLVPTASAQSPADACLSLATFELVPATITGTEGNDVIRGTSGPDVIVGLGGNDVIWGLGGDDTICGGLGNDRIDGGAGSDSILGDIRRELPAREPPGHVRARR